MRRVQKSDGEMKVTLNSTLVRWMLRSWPLSPSRRFRQDWFYAARACSALGAMLALAGPAHSKDAARENAANELLSGRALTLADLEGANIHIKLVTEMLVQREGGPQSPVTTEVDWNITAEPVAKIAWGFQPTAHTGLGPEWARKLRPRRRWISLGIHPTARPSGSSVAEAHLRALLPGRHEHYL